MGAEDNDDSGDSNYNGYHPGFGGDGGRVWPRTTRFEPAFWSWESRQSIIMGDVLCPLRAPRSVMSYLGRVSAKPATLTSRVEAGEAQEVDFAPSPYCSPTPVKSIMGDPMLIEALLCMPKPDVRTGTCAMAMATHYIDVYPCGGRVSLSDHVDLWGLP